MLGTAGNAPGKARLGLTGRVGANFELDSINSGTACAMAAMPSYSSMCRTIWSSARQLLHDFSPLSLTRDGHCGGVEIGVADGLEQTISLPLADAVLNKSLLPDGVGEAIERGKSFAVLQNDVY